VNAWLVAAYAVLALGLAWTLTGRGSGWMRRAPYIVAAPSLALALWLGQPNPAGWPSTAKVPSRAGLLWALVTEPDPANADPGRIYLWLDTGRHAPRAYSLPYSRSLHEQVQRALSTIKHGGPVELQRSAKSRRGPTDKQTNQAPGNHIRFVVNARVQLPPKTH